MTYIVTIESEDASAPHMFGPFESASEAEAWVECSERTKTYNGALEGGVSIWRVFAPEIPNTGAFDGFLTEAYDSFDDLFDGQS